jgi:hypothetical protein
MKRRKGRKGRASQPIAEVYGTHWEPDPDSSRKIEKHDRLRMPWVELVTEADIADLEANTGLEVLEDRREWLCLNLDCAFTVLTFGRHTASAAPPNEIRDRMEQVRDTAHRLLTHLGINPEHANSDRWQPTGLNFNGTVYAGLVDAANGDRGHVTACAKAVGDLARFADVIRLKKEEAIEENRSDSQGSARKDCARCLAAAFHEAFDMQPTETGDGPWEKFSIWAFRRAGHPITPHAARDLLRSIKPAPPT